jgi:DNA-binding GntR family transcriptional regulator
MSIDRRLLSTQVYERIKENIISLRYLPGSVLKERDLAKSMNVSRTPVREAVQRLSQEFWVVSGENKGIQVRGISINDICEVRQIRAIVESAAAQSAISNGQTRVLAGQLDMRLGDMCNAKDQYTFTKLDIDFHSIFVDCMNNVRLSRFWRMIQEEVMRMALMTLRENDRFIEVIHEHRQLIDSLWAKDADKIMAAVREHINNSYKALLSRIVLPECADDPITSEPAKPSSKHMDLIKTAE